MLEGAYVRDIIDGVSLMGSLTCCMFLPFSCPFLAFSCPFLPLSCRFPALFRPPAKDHIKTTPFPTLRYVYTYVCTYRRLSWQCFWLSFSFGFPPLHAHSAGCAQTAFAEAAFAEAAFAEAAFDTVAAVFVEAAIAEAAFAVGGLNEPAFDTVAAVFVEAAFAEAAFAEGGLIEPDFDTITAVFVEAAFAADVGRACGAAKARVFDSDVPEDATEARAVEAEECTATAGAAEALAPWSFWSYAEGS